MDHDWGYPYFRKRLCIIHGTSPVFICFLYRKIDNFAKPLHRLWVASVSGCARSLSISQCSISFLGRGARSYSFLKLKFLSTCRWQIMINFHQQVGTNKNIYRELWRTVWYPTKYLHFFLGEKPNRNVPPTGTGTAWEASWRWRAKGGSQPPRRPNREPGTGGVISHKSKFVLHLYSQLGPWKSSNTPTLVA